MRKEKEMRLRVGGQQSFLIFDGVDDVSVFGCASSQFCGVLKHLSFPTCTSLSLQGTLRAPATAQRSRSSSFSEVQTSIFETRFDARSGEKGRGDGRRTARVRKCESVCISVYVCLCFFVFVCLSVCLPSFLLVILFPHSRMFPLRLPHRRSCCRWSVRQRPSVRYCSASWRNWRTEGPHNKQAGQPHSHLHPPALGRAPSLV